MLRQLQSDAFQYFLNEADPTTGLIADKNQPGYPASIAATGMGLSAFIIGVERGYLTREDAIERVLKILRFFYNSRQGRAPNATGYKGFYYHFLTMNTGERAWKCELSTIDTAILIAGALSTAYYFMGENTAEEEIRELAHKLYLRVDWQWALNKGSTISHGWKPLSGFMRYRWEGEYSEAMIMYALALGSPTFPINSAGYFNWTGTFKLTRAYDIDYLYAGPLFIHQFSHMWIDFRDIYDAFNKQAGFDYFQNSRRATLVHQQYAIENPNNFEHFGKYCWGLTAGDGPGKRILTKDGRKRKFHNYIARGAPYGPDDGTISPSAVVASLPFAPELVIETLTHSLKQFNHTSSQVNLLNAGFNPAFSKRANAAGGWISQWKVGLNQGPVVMMIENYDTGMIWTLMKQCTYLVIGLQKAGFEGGWLQSH